MSATSSPSSHDLCHRKCVSAVMLSIGAGDHVVCAGRGRHEVPTAVDVAVRRAVDQVAARIVESTQVRGQQGVVAVRRGRALYAETGRSCLPRASPQTSHGRCRTRSRPWPNRRPRPCPWWWCRPGNPYPPRKRSCRLRRRSRHVRHRKPVGSLEVAPRTGGHVVGAVLGRREGHKRVPTLPAIVVIRPRDQIPVRVVNPRRYGSYKVPASVAEPSRSNR